MRSPYIGLTMVLLMVLASCNQQPKVASELNINALANERLAMRELFTQTSDNYAAFDAEAAKQKGFSAEAIQLAQEEVALSNEVLKQLEATSQGDILSLTENIKVESSKYPAFEAFTNAVAKLEAAGNEVNLEGDLEREDKTYEL
jgi:hypothetical protein